MLQTEYVKTTKDTIALDGKQTTYDVVVVGGFGHVGLPLAVSFAYKGKKVCALDIDAVAQRRLEAGEMPFQEAGCEERLRAVLQDGSLHLSLDPDVIAQADTVVIIIGTPVDRHLNPEFETMLRTINAYIDKLRDGQLIVLRSTVYPGTTDRLAQWFSERGKNVDVAFCPERIAEGFAIQELETLPQIISGFNARTLERCRQLFSAIGAEIIELRPIEAELAKLYNNVWRYILFATANQFFMLANDHGADFYRIHHAMTHNYPRAKSLPKPGFAAGPCLFKDAMQLAAFNNNRFYVGHAAMLVNEGLPNYLVERLKMKHDLSALTVGILGMAFKADIDDPRESLSYKLRKILLFEARRVLCSDPFVKGDGFIDTETLVAESDVVILGAPHTQYRTLAIPDGKVVVDIWNMWGGGCLI